MASITTRAGKGSPLTNNEVDANFTNLNDDKLESSEYTASDVLTKVKTVDGTGSGLDADLLDGNESTAFATSAQGDLADSALQNLVEDTTPQLGGNLDVNGFTVDGRNVSSDGSKLDGIEANATADQTAGEIKTAYESNADTNAFTDAEQSKLSGIEANADVTDTANVTAAGALMDSEVANLAQVKAFDSADYATSAQGDLADTALQPGDVGTASAEDVGTSPGNVVQLDGSGALPAVDGSNLTNVSSVASINDLTDVTITSVADGESLVYDSGTSRWVNETVTPVALSFPFFDSTGASDTIDLVANQNLPFFKADGTQDNIAVVS